MLIVINAFVRYCYNRITSGVRVSPQKDGAVLRLCNISFSHKTRIECHKWHLIVALVDVRCMRAGLVCSVHTPRAPASVRQVCKHVLQELWVWLRRMSGEQTGSRSAIWLVICVCKSAIPSIAAWFAQNSVVVATINEYVTGARKGVLRSSRGSFGRLLPDKAKI